MNYTPHQQEAIESRGEDLLISAAPARRACSWTASCI